MGQKKYSAFGAAGADLRAVQGRLLTEISKGRKNKPSPLGLLPSGRAKWELLPYCSWETEAQTTLLRAVRCSGRKSTETQQLICASP